MGTRPTVCDLNPKHSLLDKPWVDGRTTLGPWGNLCERCHGEFGVGLGIGKGQKYDKDGIKIGG